jgi:hypothetical protein
MGYWKVTLDDTVLILSPTGTAVTALTQGDCSSIFWLENEFGCPPPERTWPIPAGQYGWTISGCQA